MTSQRDLAWFMTDPQAIADARHGILPIEKAWTWMHDGRAALIRVGYATWPEVRVIIEPAAAAVNVGGVFGPGGDLRVLQYEARRAGTVTARAIRQMPAITALTAWENVGREIARQILVDGVSEDDLVIDGLTATEALARLTSATRPRPREQRRRGDERRQLIERVAEAYRQAVAAGDPRPRTTVGRQLGYSNAHVGRLLMDARRAEPPLLGPANPGRPGEAPSASP